mgnify:CR=1 FL=1
MSLDSAFQPQLALEAERLSALTSAMISACAQVENSIEDGASVDSPLVMGALDAVMDVSSDLSVFHGELSELVAAYRGAKRVLR